MSNLKVASMFAGIGGICLAFKQVSCKIIWANEIDVSACKTYRENFGTSYLMEDDIKNISPAHIPDFDILTAGFPCQPFSVAGYQKGFSDERGNLFFEIIKVLKSKKPPIIFIENVKNLVGHDNGNTFSVITNELEKLGYSIKYKVLNTMDYGNIPQNRERIYIVGFLDKQKFIKFSFPNKIKLTKNIFDIIDINVKQDKKFYYTNSRYYLELLDGMKNKDTVYQWRRTYVRENKSKVCPTLTANMGTGGHNVPIIWDNYGIRKLTPEECIKFQGFPDSFKFPNDINISNKYKQAGNSVSVPVIFEIAKKIIEVF